MLTLKGRIIEKSGGFSMLPGTRSRIERQTNIPALRNLGLLLIIVFLYPLSAEAQQGELGGTRLVDGWIAIGTGITEPITSPIERVDACWQGYHAEDPISPYLVACGCAAYGLGEGIVVGAGDIIVGALDVVTFGIFELSRQAGVIE